MCRGCWNAGGAPKGDTAEIRAAAAAVRDVYQWESAGGYLHVQIDDWNVADEYFDAEHAALLDGNDRMYHAESITTQRLAFGLLRDLPVRHRRSALALAKRFYELPEAVS